MIRNMKWKDCKSHKTFCETFTYTKKFYFHESAAINFIKNLLPEKRKTNNHDLNRDWNTWTS